MAPTVSVVIKSYDHERYVAKAIRSVLEQSFQDFEIVVHDDGSTDATPDVVRGFDDERIRFSRSERNYGISTAMNTALARANGELIAILNSDDFMLPDRLRTQVDLLRANPGVAAVFGMPRHVGEDGEPAVGFSSFATPFTDALAPRAAWLRYFFFHGNCLCAPTAMIRRAAFLGTGTYDPRLTGLQDFDRWIALLERHEIHVLSQELTAFRVRAGNRNASAPRRDTLLRYVFESFQILKRYRGFEPMFLREIFAGDIERNGIDVRRPARAWLADVALLGTAPFHRMLALDTLHAAASDDADFRRLAELTGTVNAFNIPDPDAAAASSPKRTKHAAAQAARPVEASKPRPRPRKNVPEPAAPGQPASEKVQ